MKNSELKKYFNYFVISTFTINIFSSLPVISSIQNNPTKDESINPEKPKLNTSYLKKLPKNDYIIGPGDSLRVTVARQYPELLTKVSVDGEGTIYLPRTNRIYVEGLSIKELSALLNKVYKNYVKYPSVEVEVESYRPIKVLVNGEVSSPGIKTLEGAMTTTVNPLASKQGTNFDFNNNSAPSSELTDNLLKLSQGNNFLSEAFNNPIIDNINPLDNFRTKTNYYFPTIIDAIRQSGGITEYTNLTSVEIIRKNNISEGGGKIKTNLNLEGVFFSTDDSQNIRIYDGDIIYLNRLNKPNGQLLSRAVKAKINPASINVLVAGRVNRPGLTTIFRDGTLNDAIDIAGGTKILKGPVRYVSFENNGTLEKRTFKYNRKNKRGSYKNPYLSNGDVIIIGDSALSLTNDIITEFTSPITGIFSTYALIKAVRD